MSGLAVMEAVHGSAGRILPCLEAAGGAGGHSAAAAPIRCCFTFISITDTIWCSCFCFWPTI